MEDTLVQTLIVCLIFAVIFGPLTARSALRREPVHGGPLAYVFNFAGACSMVGVIPGVITALVLGGGFRLAFPVALGFLLLTGIMMILFAIVELPARTRYLAAQQANTQRGWTAEDARKSGL